MKLDSQLLYNILETIEVIQTTFKPVNVRDDFSAYFSDYELDVVLYHVRLLEDLGLIVGVAKPPLRSTDERNYIIERLTFDGHAILHKIKKGDLSEEDDTHKTPDKDAPLE